MTDGYGNQYYTQQGYVPGRTQGYVYVRPGTYHCTITNGNFDAFINDSSSHNTSFTEEESDYDLITQLEDFYQWLVRKAKKIGKKNPRATRSIDAIIDRIEEMFPELTPEECYSEDGYLGIAPPSRVGAIGNR